MKIERLVVVVEPWRTDSGYVELRIRDQANGRDFNSVEVFPTDDFCPMFDHVMKRAGNCIKKLVSDFSNAGGNCDE